MKKLLNIFWPNKKDSANVDLMDFRESWYKIVEKGLEDYKSLTPNERIWYNLECLVNAINNGGLISFYYNTEADHVEETLIDLEKLGLLDMITIITMMNLQFGDIELIKDFEKRNEIINNWNSEVDDMLERIEFNAQCTVDSVEKRLVEHIVEKKLG